MRANENRGSFIKQCIICLSLLIIIWGGYFGISSTVISNRVEADDLTKIITDDYRCVFHMDEMTESNGKLIMTGWAFRLGVDATEDDIEILLYDEEKKDILYPNTERTLKEDVNQYFQCGFDYSESGFVSAIKLRKLDLQNRNYEVLLSVKNTGKIYQTNTFITSNGLSYVNPKVYVPLDVAGTDVEDVVNNGVLRVYRPEFGSYVYQYEQKLYWFADDSACLESDGSTFMQYQLDTTQISKLPSERLENGWDWDNKGFVFEENEILDKNTGSYRVAVMEIPTEYAVTRIWTGYHVNEWVWRQDFRPYYE